MSLGILGGKEGRVLRGLGGEPPPSAWCWKSAGYAWGAAFDECHAKNYRTCDGQNYELKLSGKPQMTKAQFDDCVYVKDNMSCNCPALDPGKPSAAAATANTRLTFGNKTSDPRVAELQRAINATLARNGYAAIGTDGKLGPGTCGAAREADKFGAGLMTKYGLAGVCTSFTTPVKSGGGGGAVQPVVTGGGGGSALAPADSMSASTGLFGINVKTALLVGAVGVGAYVLFSKKKPGVKT